VTLAKWLKIWAVRSAAVEDMVSNKKKKKKKKCGFSP
jgi:hypothetical protein